MAQGQCVSLLVRVHSETGRAEFADAALRGLRPLSIPTSHGGAHALLDGEPFPEEYPTSPPSFVLNGGIFALWGYHDVAVALDDADAALAFDRGVTTLAASIHRWDTGYWSSYDLYPHPLLNVANTSYHSLHIKQLRILEQLSPRPEIAAAAERFASYATSNINQWRALSRKVLFRLAIPRNHLVAGRLPWDRATGVPPLSAGSPAP
jgi:heparosan-N-sulfate-glucuronate 5-epimerase